MRIVFGGLPGAIIPLDYSFSHLVGLLMGATMQQLKKCVKKEAP